MSNILGMRAKSIEKKKCLKGHTINNIFYWCTIKDRQYSVINSANIEAVKPGAWVATGHVGGWRIAGDLSLWQVCLWIK
jgi:hypothetical protein